MPLKQGARTTRDPCGEDARSRGNERAGGIRAPRVGRRGPHGEGHGKGCITSHRDCRVPGDSVSWVTSSDGASPEVHTRKLQTHPQQLQKAGDPSPCNVPLSPSTEKTMRLLFKKQERQPGGGIASIIAEHVLGGEFGAESHKFRTDTRLKWRV